MKNNYFEIINENKNTINNRKRDNNNIISLINILNKQIYNEKKEDSQKSVGNDKNTIKKKNISKIYRGISNEWKNQFIVKQSFKRIYSKNNYIVLNNIQNINKDIKKDKINNWNKKNNILKNRIYKKLINICKNKNINNNNLNPLTLIETRIDILLCQLKWAKSLNDAHSLIQSGKIFIFENNKYNLILPSQIYKLISVGTTILFNINNNDRRSGINKLNSNYWPSSYLYQFLFNDSYLGAILVRLPNKDELLFLKEHQLSTFLNTHRNSSYISIQDRRQNLLNFISNNYYFTQLFDKFII